MPSPLAVSPEEAIAELNAVLASPSFARSPRLARLLAYLCTKSVAGEGDHIKEYSIGIEVLDRPATFDPATDAGARVEVHRLRRRLQKYYESEGASRSLRIVVPVGHYAPSFVPNTRNSAGAAPAEDTGELAYEPADGVLSGEPESEGLKVPRGFLAVAGLVLLAGTLLFFLLGRKAALPGVLSGYGSILPVADAASHAPPFGALSAGSSLRLSCGRTISYTDRSGWMWGADRYFQGGTAFDSPRQYFARANDSRLFQTGRSGDFSYEIPLAKGDYELQLGFVETTYGPGTPSGGGEYSRTFDVKANGRVLLDDFDIYSDASGTNVADFRVFKDISPASDGFLHLEFHSRRGPALVNTIQLSPAEPHRLNPIRIVAQENFLTLSNGTVWAPDTYVNGGQLNSHAITLTGDEPDLYARERYGHFDYAIPVDAGIYGVTLHFAEEYFGSGNLGAGGAGSRVFDVYCNGTALLRNFDIFKEAGINRALVKTFHGLTPNSQGKLVISFVPVRNYASLYALEVTDEARYDRQPTY